jgi:cytochrome c
VAAYILSQDRPEFEGHKEDWPKGGRRDDIMIKKNESKSKMVLSIGKHTLRKKLRLV